jgi:small-conductance mechanosensitive channel
LNKARKNDRVFSTLLNKNDELKTEIKLLENQIDAGVVQNETIKYNKNAYEKWVKELRETIQRLEERLRKKRKEYKDDIADEVKYSKEKSEELNQKEKELNNVKEELEKLKKEKEKLKDREGKMKTQIEELKRQYIEDQEEKKQREKVKEKNNEK